MAGTTTNFGFDYPTSTDYVKDGATAIQALADDVDGRFGDITNFPNQIVNRVSGVNRPLPYAMEAGQASVTGSASITFTSGRFTQAPLVTATVSTTNGTRWGVSVGSASTSGITLYNWNGTAAGTVLVGIQWTAIQMKSATAAG